MRKYFVIDKANLQSAIFLLAKDEIDLTYRFIDLSNDSILPIRFKNVVQALNWLDIGYEWDSVEF